MEDYEVDEQDLAAQMGFGSFGGPPKSKKRKFGLTSIDIESPTQQSGKLETEKAHQQPSVESSNNQHAATTGHRAARNGIRNEQGDTAYFMPSFIEDPWAELMKKRGE